MSSGTSKVSGLFSGKRGRNTNQLQELSNAAAEERAAQEKQYTTPTLPRLQIVIHACAIFFTFLAVCITGGVAGFQAKWVGVCE